MNTVRTFDFELFHQIPVIGILRGQSQEKVMEFAGMFFEAGFTTLEVTMNSVNVLETVSKLLQSFAGRLNIGVGTVRNLRQAEEVLDIGAQFVVSPVVDAEVIRFCVDHELPVFPGAYTPTEVETAWRLGATAVKLFPAAIGGLPYLKAIKAPLDDIPLIPTGGVDHQNIGDFFHSGVFGVGMGGGLFPKSFYDHPKRMLEHLKLVAGAYNIWKSGL